MNSLVLTARCVNTPPRAPRHRARPAMLGLAIVMLHAACSTGYAGDRGKPVEAAFRPSFELKPLVQRYEAPPGKVIDFAFDARALGGSTRLQIQPVGLIQNEDGQIEPDEDATPSGLRMLSPAAMDLKASRPGQIRGRLTVPTSGAFHAFGLLVTDLGPPPDEGRGKDPEQVSIGVKFVTRYLLRIEVVARGVRDDSALKLQVDEGGLTDMGGLAHAGLLVTNPTNTQFEFQAEGRLYRVGGSALGPSFKLAMPCRNNQNDRHRYHSRLLGHSKVRVRAAVPEPVLPGEYELEVTLKVDGRSISTRRFPVTVTPDMFPAQAAVVASIVQGVSVSPTHLELSLRPRGNRLMAVKIANTTDRPVDVFVQPRAASGTDGPPPWAVVRPDRFQLSAGMTRNVLVTLTNGERFTEHQYARLQVQVSPTDGGAGGQRELPMALITRTETPVKLSLGSVTWDPTPRSWGFEIPVVNEGRIHVPLNGTIKLTDSFGRSVELKGGFDRWLMPGEAGKIRFPFLRPLPPGPYTVQASVVTGGEPLRVTQEVMIDQSTLSGVP
jgi:mRNA-degrading endonuclease toxin of MazEF toxin-antitoxin module